jgi:hypothetical protein
MKLLFNIEDEEISADEIKQALGFTDADFSFKNLLPDINSATKEVRKLISPEVYLHIYDFYKDNIEDDGTYVYDYEDMESNILRQTRYPILVKAYSLFAPSNDISHSNEGRRARTSENEKLPWQWQIDADNKEQEKRFYRAMDDLIDLLDESMPEDYESLSDEDKQATIYFKWINSAAYKELKSLFVNSIDKFNKVFTIESSLLLHKLASGLQECEEFEILSRIGKEKFDQLKSSEPTEDPKDIQLLKLIHTACVFYSLAWAIPKMSITIFPEGVLQYQVSDRSNTIAKKPAIGNEHEYAMQSFAKSSQLALKLIEELVKPVPEPSADPTTFFTPSDSCSKGLSL